MAQPKPSSSSPSSSPPQRKRLRASARVSDALATRFSCRAFLPKAVDKALVQQLLQHASRAPSGGNLQPWHVWALSGEPLKKLVTDVGVAMRDKPGGLGSEYHIYPPNLTDPYEARRRDIGARLYELLGIAREDKMAKLGQLAKNFEFFGAQTALFFAIDKQMQEGQWSDLGMFLQSIMLLAREYGLHTCPQEAWAVWAPLIKKFLNIPDHMTFFCGMALGHADPHAVVNQLESPRAALEDYATFVGF